MRGERVANPIAGPTTTGLVQASAAPITVSLIAASWSTAGTLIARVGSGSGPIVGALSVAAAGTAVLSLDRPVLCQTGLHFTITGTCTESSAHVS
jgi:hypothetical protein